MSVQYAKPIRLRLPPLNLERDGITVDQREVEQFITTFELDAVKDEFWTLLRDVGRKYFEAARSESAHTQVLAPPRDLEQMSAQLKRLGLSMRDPSVKRRIELARAASGKIKVPAGRGIWSYFLSESATDSMLESIESVREEIAEAKSFRVEPGSRRSSDPIRNAAIPLWTYWTKTLGRSNKLYERPTSRGLAFLLAALALIGCKVEPYQILYLKLNHSD